MFLTYLISSLTITSIFFMNIKRVHPEKEASQKNIYLLILGGSLLTALINLAQIPLLNLSVSLTICLSISYLFFTHYRVRDYLLDILIVFIIAMVDGLIFFIVKSFMSFNNLVVEEHFLAISSSIIFVIISLLINKLFDITRAKKIPALKLLPFVFILIFQVLMITIFNFEIATYASFSLKMIVFITTIGIIITDGLLVYYLNNLIDKYDMENEHIQKEKENELRQQYYDNLKEKYENQRKIAHDFKNHIQVISNAYESEKPQMAEQIIKNVAEAYNNELLYNTNSEILNIIINDKAKKARENNIEFLFSTELTDMSFISDFDMITLFGNIYDNAIEANLKITDERLIETKISKLNEMLIITIKNNYNNILNYKNKKIVSTKTNHRGIGLTNIKEVVDKYNGMLNIDDKFGIFVISIAIPTS